MSRIRAGRAKARGLPNNLRFPTGDPMRTILTAAIALALALPASAQGRAVRATHARFQVAIVDGIATVDLALGLHNDGAGIGEADWILPLPEGAVADGFTTQIGDAPAIAGEVLDASNARAVYERIVRRRRDPGLLEYAGRGCLRARLFPIPPGADAQVKIRWRQVLPVLNGLMRWSQLVATSGIEGRAPEQVTFMVDVHSSSPIRTALSPTPGADVRLIDEHKVKASFEPGQGQALPKELALYYGLSDDAFGLHLLAQRESADQDGFFTLLISPKQDWKDDTIPPRAVSFVLDVSGSMAGKKIAQAKGALRQFLGSLRPIDRFDVVLFSTAAESFFGKTVEASEKNVADALARVDSIEARGGTNLEAGLRSGIPDRGPEGKCLPICMVLSDGLPTAGETGVPALRELARKLVGERGARVFVFGVGSDVHTVLLDDLAEVGRGTRQYVRVDEDIEERVSDLCAKIGRPVMSDLVVSIDGAAASKLAPSRLPDLFAGSRLVLTGRYAKPGRHTVRLRGKVGALEREYVYEAEFPSNRTAHDFVPKLWATRHVAGLLEEIRRNGEQQELLDEVRRLGVEFQIVTPYTSHLVVEDALGAVTPPRPGSRGGRAPGPSGPSTPGPGGPATGGPGGPATQGGKRYMGPGDAVPPGGGAQPGLEDLAARLQAAGVLPKDAEPGDALKLAGEIAREMQRSAAGLSNLRDGRVTGAGAVEDSIYLAQLLQAGEVVSDSAEYYLGSGTTRRPSLAPDAIAALFVRRVADKVFVLREGCWTDRTFDAKQDYAETRKVEAFSDGYFALLKELPALARYVALSERMKIVLGKLLIEITPPPPEEPDVEQPEKGKKESHSPESARRLPSARGSRR